MSYDLMVFDTTAAPSTRSAFMEWYRQQTQWPESHGYNNPEVPASALREWFLEMIKTFPPMNGPLASDDFDDPKVTEYSLGETAIYACFAWSQAEQAYRQMFDLAAKHQVGFFDVSATDGDIWLPATHGKLVKLPR
jgi:hypothetical protein